MTLPSTAKKHSEEFVTVGEVTTLLGIRLSTAQNLCKRLPSITIAVGRKVYKLSDVHARLAAQNAFPNSPPPGHLSQIGLIKFLHISNYVILEWMKEEDFPKPTGMSRNTINGKLSKYYELRAVIEWKRKQEGLPGKKLSAPRDYNTRKNKPPVGWYETTLQNEVVASLCTGKYKPRVRIVQILSGDLI
jgi:hypothetical protein